MPVPLSERFVGEVPPSLTKEILPVTAPSAAGLKVTFAVVDTPGERLTGKESPLRLKPAPVTLALEMVSVDSPELLRVTPRVLLLPTLTLPKSRVAGFRVS